MFRTHDRMPQFNWPVFGPLLGILFTLLLVGFVVGSRVWSNVSAPERPSAAGANPDLNAPLPRNPGIGGPGSLRAPDAQQPKLRSISARVSGAPTVRRGPGTQYAEAYALQTGEEVHVIACSPGCEWLRILSLTEPDAQLWIPSVFLVLSGRLDSLPVLTPQ